MIEQWLLEKIEKHRHAPLVIVRDPQRMIQAGGQELEGWANANNMTVVFCAGNLALREMFEAIGQDSGAHTLLIDRSRDGAKAPLFYPDLDAKAGKKRQMTLTLRDFLIEQTGDPHWPHLVNERNLSRLALGRLPAILETHRRFRAARSSGFGDTDLYKIILGAALDVDPFRRLSAVEVRRVSVERHRTLDELDRTLPAEVMETWRGELGKVPKPFCWLLERDAKLVVRAFTLAAILHQHGLDYRLLLSNIDPLLHEYREIDSHFLESAMREQMAADPDQVAQDVGDVEQALLDHPEQLAFILRDQLQVDDAQHALQALERERLSPLIRATALFSLLADLLTGRKLKFHAKVHKLLQEQETATDILALRRPTEEWNELADVYGKAMRTLQLANRSATFFKQLKVTPDEKLDIQTFDALWNQDGLNRLDYYASDLERGLRVGNFIPLRQNAFWRELAERWQTARSELSQTVHALTGVQQAFDARFQDLYRLHYAEWIRDPNAPAVFSHQFLDRVVKPHWDPQSGQRAVILVFDGMRSDAWDELLRPVLEERFHVVETRPGSALIPSETHLSRKAIAAGCLPEQFSSQSELKLLQGWLQERMGIQPVFETIKDDDTAASGMTVRYRSDKLEYIIFNFTDKNLHGNTQDLAFIYHTTVREIIRQDVRSVLRELPDEALLFVVSDHGFAPVPIQPYVLAESLVAGVHDIKYRSARLKKAAPENERQFLVDFDARTLGIPLTSEADASVTIHSVVFPRPGRTFQRPRGPHSPDRYSHGGLSLAECMTPMVVLGPKRAAQPLLRIERFVQTGSIAEGEALTLEVTLAPMRIGAADQAVTLTFSRQEIGMRREVLSGKETTFTVHWMPKLGEIPEEARAAGELRLPVTVIVSWQEGGETVRVSGSVTARVKLDPTRLRRRVDSKLDLMMGKPPKNLT